MLLTRHDFFFSPSPSLSLPTSLHTASYCNIEPHDLSCEWEKVQGTWGRVDIQLLYVMYEMDIEGGERDASPVPVFGRHIKHITEGL